jgi:hypothetical protein
MFEPPHEADESPSRRTMASDASPLPLPQTTTSKALLSLDRVRQLQGHAAECHSFGALPEAIHCWSSILRELVPHLVGGGEDTDDRAASGGTDALRTPDTILLELWIAPVAHAPGADDAIFALFPYVLVYSAPEPHTPIGTGEHRVASGSDVVRRMGAAVAYNLALAYQMQALQGSHRVGHHASLRTALSAYKAARDMLLSARQRDSVTAAQGWKDPARSSSSSSEHEEDDRLLLLAITNNEGQILEALHERTRVVESLQDLRHGLKGTLSPAGICGHFTVTDALFGDPDVVQFMHPPAA